MELAFAPAESGICESFHVLHDQLKAEGYADNGQLQGRAVRAQLVKIMAAAKKR